MNLREFLIRENVIVLKIRRTATLQKKNSYVFGFETKIILRPLSICYHKMAMFT